MSYDDFTGFLDSSQKSDDPVAMPSKKAKESKTKAKAKKSPKEKKEKAKGKVKKTASKKST